LSLYFTSLPFVPLGVSRSRSEDAKPEVNVPIPPAGVDAGAFYKLVAHRRDGSVDGLLSSGAYVNNTSVVFRLEWKGWKLLFTGDAQTASWGHMNRTGGLRPIHFLKTGHHGSHNATPYGKWFNRILPKQSSDGKRRVAAISAYKEAYGHPHKQVKDRLDKRCDAVVLTEQSPSIKYVDFDFDEQDVSIRSVRQF
jgi:beta-lactamase superfamily II metal-dependent hydrolase